MVAYGVALPKITARKMMSFGPCPPYKPARVRELWGSRPTLDALDILDLKIPSEDKLWAVLRSDLIPEADLHELACRFAELALRRERKAGREPDARSWAAVAAKRRWLRGEISDEALAAAAEAAAAEAVTAYAAVAAAEAAAAHAAAAHAAAVAAVAAAAHAVVAAARAAARAAFRATVSAEQVAIVRRLLRARYTGAA
jgi:hypothetical protein